MTVLKPCPFCGSIPRVDTHSWKYFEDPKSPYLQIRQRVIIKCNNCFLQKDIVSIKLAALGTSEKDCKRIAKIAAGEVIDKLWNERWNGNGKRFS